jgi:hypothetical protein
MVRDQIIKLALDEPTLSLGELAVPFKGISGQHKGQRGVKTRIDRPKT